MWLKVGFLNPLAKDEKSTPHLVFITCLDYELGYVTMPVCAYVPSFLETAKSSRQPLSPVFYSAFVEQDHLGLLQYK